jgi:hypothetical protein
MPCLPSWEEMMVLRGESAAKRLAEEYPLLQKRYFEMLEIYESLGFSLNWKLDMNEVLPELPEISKDDWPTREDGILMENYLNKVLEIFSKIELWLCQTTTELILLLDKNENLAKPASIATKIKDHIEHHKKHREEDRAEKARTLRQQITWYDTALKLNKYSHPTRRDEDLKLKKDLEERLELLMSYSIEELIRDRSITEI